MPDRIVLEVYKDGLTGQLQLSISKLDENNRGSGYRLVGPKFNGASELMLEHTLDQQDAGEIRWYLALGFPPKAIDAVVGEQSPTEPAELGVWLRALPHRTILTDRDGNACQIDTGEEHIHRAPNRHFRALCLGGHPYEITEGHEEIEALAKWSGPFTVLKRGALAESAGDAA
ncbi:MAG TPA: hypothetical protein VGS97_20165 [Actinocrinis sp.]|uniref:hypothetical protein n=1 Tax=Actinocrinis sp. TaxID=1920516 RepID=UPI002DDCFB4D|nr:hypothetical protein [Actinocrinis sp.]HEV2346425.1 hypothetical protein [Actinocrinis sp.]